MQATRQRGHAKRAERRQADQGDGIQADHATAQLAPQVNVQWIASGGDNAEIVERSVRRHEATGGWRATLRVRALDEKRPMELRGQLNADGVPLSEVWSYIVPPE